MEKNEGKIQLEHPDPGKTAPRIAMMKYKMMKNILLTVIPNNDEGIPFKELAELVTKQLSIEELEYLGSVGWYTTTVKLDLEAKRIIQSVPGSRPQRVRRLA